MDDDDDENLPFSQELGMSMSPTTLYHQKFPSVKGKATPKKHLNPHEPKGSFAYIKVESIPPYVHRSC